LVSGPKPDQYEEHHTGPQADNMRGAETAVVPGDPVKNRNGYQDDYHQYQKKSLGGHGAGPRLWILWRLDLLGVCVGFRIALWNISITIVAR
jgi:hypothetical protein